MAAHFPASTTTQTARNNPGSLCVRMIRTLAMLKRVLLILALCVIGAIAAAAYWFHTMNGPVNSSGGLNMIAEN